MGYNNGVITKPVSIDDVKKALGASSNDLGTLCRNENINMWSRHKPVAYASVVPIGFGDSDGSNEAKKVSYGIKPGKIIEDVVSIEDSNITDLYENAEYSWVYTKPAGGASQPYRISDFAGYCHYAVPFIVSEVHAITFNRSKTTTMYFRVCLDPADSYENLQAYDFAGASLDLSKWYLGVKFGNKINICTSPISDTDAGSFVSVSGITTNGNYDTYLFLTKVENNKRYYMRLPNANGYNNFPVRISVITDAAGAGGGVPDSRSNVWVCPDYGNESSTGWKPLNAVCEDGTASPKYRFYNGSGNIYLKIKMQNTSTTAGTFAKSKFRLAGADNGVSAMPDIMWVSTAENGSYSEASSVTIPAKSGSTNGVRYIKLLFTQNGGKSVMRGTSGAEEFSFSINGNEEFYETLLCKKDGNGARWVQA